MEVKPEILQRLASKHGGDGAEARHGAGNGLLPLEMVFVVGRCRDSVRLMGNVHGYTGIMYELVGDFTLTMQIRNA